MKHNYLTFIAFCLAGWLLLAANTAVFAANFTVCAGGCTHTTLTDAIAASSDGDTITVMDAVHTEQGIIVDKSLIIQGQGAANTAVQAAATRASATDRVFYISNTAVVTFQDITIRHGNTSSVSFSSGGGIHNLDGTVTINDSILFDNLTHNGGGIHNAPAGTVTINNSTILDNDTEIVSTKRGGGIDNRGMMTVNNSTISGNTASNYFGGGIYNTGIIEINNSVITNNRTADGGGVYNGIGGEMTINNSTISGNTALYANGFSLGGGGVYNNTSSTMTINNSTISGNSAATVGGGINNRGTLSVNNSTVVDNNASNVTTGGGGILQTSGTLNLNRTIVSGNGAPVNAEVHELGGTINANNFNVLGHSGLDNTQAFGASFTPGGNDRTATSDGTHPTALVSILNTTLANNGGSTLTHALVSGSPAIDFIPTSDPDCNPGVTADQRGAARANGANSGGSACDVGAVEFESGFTPSAVSLATFSANPELTGLANLSAFLLLLLGASTAVFLHLRHR